MDLPISAFLDSPIYLFHVTFYLLLGYWVFVDAGERGSDNNLLWALVCLAVPPLLVGYLLYRSEIGGRQTPPALSERVVGTFVLGHFVAVQLWFVLRYVDLFPVGVMAPLVELGYYLPLLGVGIVIGYWLVWRGGWARIRRRLGWTHKSEPI